MLALFKIMFCALGLWAAINLIVDKNNLNRLTWLVVVIGVILPLVLIWKS